MNKILNLCYIYYAQTINPAQKYENFLKSIGSNKFSGIYGNTEIWIYKPPRENLDVLINKILKKSKTKRIIIF